MKRSLTLALILLLNLEIYSQAPDTLWTRKIGGNLIDVGNEVVQTNDGGFIIAGYTSSFGAGQRDAFLIRLDSLGGTVWTNTYGTTLLEHAMSVKQTNDMGFIISAFKFGNNSDLWLIKIDGNGDTLWTKTIGYASDEFGTNLQLTDEGGFFITGYTNSIGSGDRDMWLLKFDSSGEKIWEKTFGGSAIEEGYKILKLSDGNLLIPGYTQDFSTQERDSWIVKADTAGNYIWDKNLGITGYDDFTSAAEGDDGSYFFTGSIQTTANGRDLRIAKTDSAGSLIFDRTYGGTGSDFGYDIKKLSDGNFIVTGELTESVTGFRQLWILKIDNEGDTLWTKLFISVNGSGGYSIDQTRDGGFIITGISNSTVSGTDVSIIRLAPETITGTENTIPELPTAFSLKQNYPNPFNPSTRINFSIPNDAIVIMEIYNMVGEKVATLVDEIKSDGSYSIDFNASKLPSGIYLYRISAGNYFDVKKMTLLK